MYDVRSVIRFELARLISSLKGKDLTKMLFSSSFSELELGIVDVIDLMYEVEREYFIHVPDKYLINSLEDVVSVICGNSSSETFLYTSSAPAKAFWY
ncbi:hypothetical protein ACFSKU_15600 [Pontibacter silvestris]|uniref:Acyl carrier protein n=1 Tax=Pontibacter silvestris TaxID=2305183 RepID=A0ABW4X079_9BACT|nr:hypothetical protein [Pontibacter silvestris]MCC9137551.1 hypothetical protein [Pontibacter silvestris]